MARVKLFHIDNHCQNVENTQLNSTRMSASIIKYQLSMEYINTTIGNEIYEIARKNHNNVKLAEKWNKNTKQVQLL